MDEWTLAQAICLLLGVAPDSWFGQIIGEGRRASDLFNSSHERIYREAAKLRDLMWASHNQRKLNPGGHPFATSPQPMPPGKWISWARSKGLTIPEQLLDLESSFSEPASLQALKASREKNPAEPLDDREKDALMNTIGALLKLLREPRSEAGGKARFASQAKIIDTILAAHPGRYGMSKRNLEDIFAAANRAIDINE